MWINLGLFNKYKLTPPTTLAQWVSVCKTFRANGVGSCFREGVGSPGFDVDTIHSIVNSVDRGPSMRPCRHDQMDEPGHG